MLEETFPASDAPSWGGSTAECERRDRATSSTGRALKKSGGLQGKTFAILATNGFEPSELMKPREALLKAGAAVELVSLAKKPIKGWRKKKWGDEIEVDIVLHSARPSHLAALFLLG